MPAHRRILSLWFPHLAAETHLRAARGRIEAPLAVVAEVGNALSLSSLSPAAAAEGLHPGQALRDAQALCPALITVAQNPLAEAAFLTRLRRWAGRYSPWVAEEKPTALLLDISGCAHLFGGEAAMAAEMVARLGDMGLTARLGLADTPGAAWALARYAGAGAAHLRSGDAIDQEARATRSRAVKRKRWEKGGTAPQARTDTGDLSNIAPPGQTRTAIGRLPVAALRLEAAEVTNLNRLGIRLIADLAALPRSALARRFGAHVMRRLDQALGAEPEPVSPARPPHHFACRLSLPDPIGLQGDLEAGFDRLLGPLCDKLHRAARGARHLRLTLFRTDHTQQVLEVGLARPSHDPDRIRPLMLLQLPQAEAGFGIDVMRLEAHVTEPLSPSQHAGHAEAVSAARKMRDEDTAMADLLGRLGARIGLEQLIRLHPADSHIPEKAATRMAAAYSAPAPDWPAPPRPRPLCMFTSEIVMPEDDATPPTAFRWRRRLFRTCHAQGPERIAPEWWLDDPAWRSGTRDYWRIDTDQGERLWLYQTRSGDQTGGWFCHGTFA